MARPLQRRAGICYRLRMAPSTQWRELAAPGEQAHLERLANELLELQRRAAKGGKPARGLHAKQQAAVEAEFEILDILPAHARVGPFEKPGRYKAWVRFSNGSGTRQPDRKPDVRGVAIKLVGVEGRKIIDGLQDAVTQDFLLVRNPAMPFPTPDDFVWLVKATASPALMPLKAIARFGFARGWALLRSLVSNLRVPATSAATTRYYSALPIRFGDYAVKYRLQPHARDTGPLPASPEAFGDDLADRLRQGPISYDFQVQFFQDEQTTPIEDASREWLETDAPFLTVARLVIPKQDLASPRGAAVSRFVDTLSFDPWHCVEALRPLGQTMRARNVAYRLSTRERGAAREPDGTERLDHEVA